MPFKVPIIIFAEYHYDPITGTILAELIPELKKKGYQSFYDEVPYWMQDKFFKYLEDEEQKYQKLLTQFKKLNLDISDTGDIYKFNELLKDSLPEKEWKEKSEEIVDNIDKHDARITFIEFLKRLHKSGINYEAIDSNDIQLGIPISELEALTKSRDAEMTQAYLSANHPVFGRIGLKHAEGIQQELLNNIPLEEVSDGFLFFAVYSREIDNYSDWLYAHELENGKKKLPTNIIFIDATNLSTRDVLDIIKQHIEVKEKALGKYHTKEDKNDILLELVPTEETKQLKSDSLNKRDSHKLFKDAEKKEVEPTLAVRWSKFKPFM